MGIKSIFNWLATAFASLFSTRNAKNKPFKRSKYASESEYNPFETGKRRRNETSPFARKKRKQKNAAERRARKRMYAAR